MINHHRALSTLLIAMAGATGAQAGTSPLDARTLIVTASNNVAANQLLVYSATGTLLRQIPTQGQGGVSGNSGGIAQNHERLAVVNYTSGTVSVFWKEPERASFRLETVLAAVANPVSVTFGSGHLYILSTTHVESHAIGARGVAAAADGVAGLLHADGSAAQVGKLAGELLITEKSNAIESVALNAHGAVSGSAVSVANIPANVSAPFGLVTRGNEAYVSLAHNNEVSLVRHDTVLALGSTGTQNAPCWVSLDGPFLFTTNSPSHSISRFAVYGQVIVADALVAASFNGAPTDIDSRSGLAAVVDASGAVSHLSTLHIDEDGHLTAYGSATIDSAATNGVLIVGREDRDED